MGSFISCKSILIEWFCLTAIRQIIFRRSIVSRASRMYFTVIHRFGTQQIIISRIKHNNEFLTEIVLAKIFLPPRCKIRPRSEGGLRRPPNLLPIYRAELPVSPVQIKQAVIELTSTSMSFNSLIIISLPWSVGVYVGVGVSGNVSWSP